MTYYEVRKVEADPDVAFQAACNACARTGLRASGVHLRGRVAIYASGLHFKRGSLGEYVTVRAWAGPHGTMVGFEGTAYFGKWSRATVDGLLDAVTEDFDAVLAAPQARMRPIQMSPRLVRPFGQVPRVLAVVSLVAALVFWTLIVGGSVGVFATTMAFAHAVLVSFPSRRPWWRVATPVLAILHLPTGLIGQVAGRLALAQALWPKASSQAPQGGANTVPIVRAPRQ